MSNQILANPFYNSSRFAGKRLHLGITGSIACYKACDLLRSWLSLQMQVSATLTKAASNFIAPLLLKALGGNPVYTSMFDDSQLFAHLEPGQAADAFAIVPASADFIAKMAQGLADDLLATQYAAYNGPCLVAPAMNPRLWEHAALKRNLELLHKDKVDIVNPGRGLMACGEIGEGRLADLQEIFLRALRLLAPKDMRGIKTLVTLGPTREAWDGVRFWSNPSSGKMGCALATAAWLRGSEVTAICGPGVNIFLPGAIKQIKILNADEMLAEAANIWPQMNIGLFCAAVADFAPDRPEMANQLKIKKGNINYPFSISFHKNEDILATLAARRANNQKLLGFAAEMATSEEELAKFASIKLESKKADIIAANCIGGENSAFNSSNAKMAVADKNGKREFWPKKSKADIAWDLISWLLTI